MRLLQRLYSQQEGTVLTDKESDVFPIKRGTKQGDPLSSLLFNTVLQYALREDLDRWQERRKGIKKHQTMRSKEFTVGKYGLLNTFGRTVQNYHQCKKLRNTVPTTNLIGMRRFTHVTVIIYLNYPLCLTSVNVSTSAPANSKDFKIEQAGSERLCL